MTEFEPKEGARWFLILLCSFVMFVVVWPAFHLVMIISYYIGSPVPVNLISTGLPASGLTGAAFVLVGQYVSRHRGLATSKKLVIIFTVLVVLMLLLKLISGSTDRLGDYVVMAIAGPAGAWVAYLNMSPNIARMKREKKSANHEIHRKT